MLEFLFNANRFMCRDDCGAWNPLMMFIYRFSEEAIFGAYVGIALILWHAKNSEIQAKAGSVSDDELNRSRAFFAAFIFSCGLGHLLERFAFFWPAYHFFALWHFVTAVISWRTFFYLLSLRDRVVAGI